MMDEPEYPVCARCGEPLAGHATIVAGVEIHRVCQPAGWIDLVIEAAMSELDAELAFLLG